MHHSSNGNNKNSELIYEILKTREIRGVLGTVVPEVLKIWAGKSTVKKAVIKPVAKNIQTGFKWPDDALEKKELQNLFGEVAFLENLTNEIPTLLDGLSDTLNEVGMNLENLPMEKKRQILEQIIKGIFNGRSGKIFTTFSRVMISIHKEHPEFVSQQIAPGILKWLEQTDFGELRDALEHATDDMIAIAKAVGDAFLQYPTKLIVLMTTLPGITNILIRSTNEWLIRLNTLSPDLLTDAAISCLKNVDGKHLSPLVNELSELVRKLNTGSALIGEPGMPRFSQEINAFIEKASESIDVALLVKARTGVNRGKESIHEAMNNVLRKHPELIVEELKTIQQKNNRKIKSATQKLNMILDELPDAEMVQAAATGISRFDAHEAAEAINLAAICANKIRETKPDLLETLANQFVGGLDLYEVEDMTKGILEECGASLKPLGMVIMPQIIKMVSGWLIPEDDEDNSEIDNAREAMLSFLNKREVNL